MTTMKKLCSSLSMCCSEGCRGCVRREEGEGRRDGPRSDKSSHPARRPKREPRPGHWTAEENSSSRHRSPVSTLQARLVGTDDTLPIGPLSCRARRLTDAARVADDRCARAATSRRRHGPASLPARSLHRRPACTCILAQAPRVRQLIRQCRAWPHWLGGRRSMANTTVLTGSPCWTLRMTM